MVDDGRRYDVADSFGVRVLERLKRHTHALPFAPERRTPAVARIDSRVDLHPQKLRRAVRIRRHLYPTNHPTRDANRDPTHRIPNHSDAVLQARQHAELHRRHALEKLLLLHRQQRQVALHADGQHLGHVLFIAPALLQLHLRVMFHAVRVRQHHVPLYDEPRARARALSLSLPRQAPVRLGVRREHLHHRVQRVLRRVLVVARPSIDVPKVIHHVLRRPSARRRLRRVRLVVLVRVSRAASPPSRRLLLHRRLPSRALRRARRRLRRARLSRASRRARHPASRRASRRAVDRRAPSRRVTRCTHGPHHTRASPPARRASTSRVARRRDGARDGAARGQRRRRARVRPRGPRSVRATDGKVSRVPRRDARL